MQPPAVVAPTQSDTVLLDHTQLPDKDGSFSQNIHEHPQSNLLTDCLLPRFNELHPDGQFCIGCDSGIYWRSTQPALDGCKAPDWFYIPNIPPLLDGQVRRSYVLWQESVRPLVVIEYVSGDGSEAHDATPYKGKFWVYEQAICAAHYAIHDMAHGVLELYRLEGGRYRLVPANEAGRFPLEPLGIELGIWQGTYRGQELSWLRVWDAATGKLLETSEERERAALDRADTAESLLDDTRELLQEECERAETERKRAESEQKRADDNERRSTLLADKLRALGIDPDAA